MSRFPVRVTPRGSRNAIEGWDPEGRLRVRLTAPPVDGEANDALVRLLAGILGVAPSRVRVLRGERGRTKTVEIEGMDTEEIRGALGAGPDSDGAGSGSKSS